MTSPILTPENALTQPYQHQIFLYHVVFEQQSYPLESSGQTSRKSQDPSPRSTSRSIDLIILFALSSHQKSHNSSHQSQHTPHLSFGTQSPGTTGRNLITSRQNRFMPSTMRLRRNSDAAPIRRLMIFLLQLQTHIAQQDFWRFSDLGS